MKRRQALQTIGAVTLSSVAAEVIAVTPQKTKNMKKAVTVTSEKIELGNAHFLSRKNPTATVDQRDAEMLAMQLQQNPVILNAKAQAAQRFKVLAKDDMPAEGWTNFDAMMDDWAYHYTLIAMNSDPNHPKAICGLFGPPHEWFGIKVRASHGPATAENVDVSYTFIPVDGQARYELHGRRFDPAVGDCPIYVASNLSMTMNVDSISWQDIDFNDDGSFVLTVGPEPANGKRNHLQTTIDTRYVYTRDARTDWRQLPIAYRIRRLDPPNTAPMSVESKAALAARFIVDDVGLANMYRKLFAAQSINTITSPETATGFGGQTTQKLCRAHLQLADDEAYIITLDPGGAGYHVLTANNMWLEALDYWNKTSSLNNGQSAANADGSYTYVVSIRDPGVHNWIDTLGLHETLIIIRLQLLPRNADGSVGGQVNAKGQVVKLNDLDSALPKGMKRVTPDQRRQQLAQRMETFRLRFIDS